MYERDSAPAHEQPSAAAALQGATSGPLDQLAARGAMTPEAIAMRILEQPHQRDAIMSMLQKTHGNGFAQAVAAAGHTAHARQVAQAPPSDLHAAAQASSFEAIESSLDLLAQELEDARGRINDEGRQNEAGDQPHLNTLEHDCNQLTVRASRLFTLAQSAPITEAKRNALRDKLAGAKRLYEMYSGAIEMYRKQHTSLAAQPQAIWKQLDLANRLWGFESSDLRATTPHAPAPEGMLRKHALADHVNAARRALASLIAGTDELERLRCHIGATRELLGGPLDKTTKAAVATLISELDGLKNTKPYALLNANHEIDALRSAAP